MLFKRIRSLALVLTAVLLMGVGLAACGGGDDESSDTTQAPETTTTTAEVFDPGSDDTSDTTEEGGDDQRAAIDEFMTELDTEIQPEEADEGYTFVEVSDDTGQLTASAPAEWSDVDGAVGPFGPDVRASTDLAAYNSAFDVPGFQFVATGPDLEGAGIQSTTGDVNRVLDALAEATSGACDPAERQPYSDPVYTGVSQVFENCVGDSAASFVWVAVEPVDEAYVAVVGVQILTDADIDALGEILDTFLVIPA